MQTINSHQHGRGLAELAYWLLASAVAFLLSGCWSNAGTGKAPPAAGNSVVALASQADEVRAYVGRTASLTLTFSTTDGARATALKLDLQASPDWQIAGGRDQCASLGDGEACQLALTYAPTAPAAEAYLLAAYTYIDSAGVHRSGSARIQYSALPANAVMDRQSPPGPVRGVVGAATRVALDFSTNDDSPASAFLMEGIGASLPAGWQADADRLSCASVGAGASCRLGLTYTPGAAAGAAMVELAYRYIDSSGLLQTGVSTIDFSAVAPNGVTAERFPSGPLLVEPGDASSVSVTFSTANGTPVQLRITDMSVAGTDGDRGLSAGQAGWRMARLDGCEAASAGRCTVNFIYAPDRRVGRGVMTARYEYADKDGNAGRGEVSVVYASRRYGVYLSSADSQAQQCVVEKDGALTDCQPVDAAGTRNVAANDVNVYFVSGDPSRGPSRILRCPRGFDGALGACSEEATAGFMNPRHIMLRGASAYLSYFETGMVGCTLSRDGGLDNCLSGIAPGNSGAVRAFRAYDFDLLVAYEAQGGASTSLARCGYSLSNRAAKCAPSVVLPDYPGRPGMHALAYHPQLRRFYFALDNAGPGAALAICDDRNGALLCEDSGARLPGRSNALLPVQDIAFHGDRVYLSDSDAIYHCAVELLTGRLSGCENAGVQNRSGLNGMALRQGG